MQPPKFNQSQISEIKISTWNVKLHYIKKLHTKMQKIKKGQKRSVRYCTEGL